MKKINHSQLHLLVFQFHFQPDGKMRKKKLPIVPYILNRIHFFIVNGEGKRRKELRKKDKKGTKKEETILIKFAYFP